MIKRDFVDLVQRILSITREPEKIEHLYNAYKGYRDNDIESYVNALSLLFKYTEDLNNISNRIIRSSKDSKEEKEIVNIIHDIGYDTKLLESVLQIIKKDNEIKDDILDSFSANQFRAKNTLLDYVDKLNILDNDSTVVIWGAWYGSILIPSLADKVKKILSIDIDNTPLQIAKNKLFNNYNNIDYICDDVFASYKTSYIDTNLIINTSCEHMPPMKEWTWFGPGAIEGDSDTKMFKTPKLSNNCYFAFQSNNMFGIEGHVNCVNSLQEFEDQLPERAEVLYREEIEDTRGTRYMLVGKFMPL